MKVYINNHIIRDPVSVYIDNVVTHREVYDDVYVAETFAVDISQIKDVIDGLEKLGYPVKKITIPSGVYLDIDTSYYRRLPEETVDKLWKNINSYFSGRETEVFIKRNRLYTIVDGIEIVLPKHMESDYDNRTLRMLFYV